MTTYYIASKAHHRPRWRDMRDAGININSRWIDTDDKYSIDSNGLNYQKLWVECIEDVQACDVVVSYIEHGEVLKGSLIEIGAAIALGKIVYLVGPIAAYCTNGTWLNHPNCEHVSSLEEVMK